MFKTTSPAMDHRNYVVRRDSAAANDSKAEWHVELEGEVVCRVRDRINAIAAAAAVARDTAEREFTTCRVSIMTERGDCVPLTAFGSKLEQQQRLMKKLARRWAA